MVAEIDRPRLLFSVVLPLAVVLLLGVVGLALWQWSTFAVEAELERKVLTRPSPQLIVLRAEEERRLHRYQWVDAKHEVVRIPVERALELVLVERAP